MKKFYKDVSVVEEDGGFAVALDGRKVKTPAKAAQIVPTKAAAQLMANEWVTQGDEISPDTMPVTRMVNSSIDSIAKNRSHVVDEIAAFGGSDLICYRADEPDELVNRQNEAWDRFHIWLAETWGVKLAMTTGVMPVSQRDEDLLILRQAVDKQNDFILSGLHTVVTISGSLVMGLAFLSGDFDIDDIWQASRVDEVYQAEEWGEDWEAKDRWEKKNAELRAAAVYIDALK